MALPETIRVKLSSEEAGAISMTQVVVRDIAIRELVEYMLGYTGKDRERVRDLLLRGSLVSGASRFRWSGWEAATEEVDTLLATFPDPEPLRPFAPERCVRAVLRGGRLAIDIPRHVGVRKPLLRRATFWDVLLDVAGSAGLQYLDYSYKDRADCYHARLPMAALDRLREAAGMVAYSSLRDQIRAGGFESIELFVERVPGG